MIRPSRIIGRRHPAEGLESDVRIGLAEKLHEETQAAVAHTEQSRRRPGRPWPGGEPDHQNKQRDTLQRELVQLRGMAR